MMRAKTRLNSSWSKPIFHLQVLELCRTKQRLDILATWSRSKNRVGILEGTWSCSKKRFDFLLEGSQTRLGIAIWWSQTRLHLLLDGVWSKTVHQGLLQWHIRSLVVNRTT